MIELQSQQQWPHCQVAPTHECDQIQATWVLLCWDTVLLFCCNPALKPTSYGLCNWPSSCARSWTALELQILIVITVKSSNRIPWCRRSLTSCLHLHLIRFHWLVSLEFAGDMHEARWNCTSVPTFLSSLRNEAWEDDQVVELESDTQLSECIPSFLVC